MAHDSALDDAVNGAAEGLGVEVAFEVAGNAAALRQALRPIRRDGTVVTAGIPGQQVPLDVAAFTFAEKRLVGSRGYTPQNWDDAATLLSSRTSD